MTDRFWLWLHRYAARKAQRVYVRTPKYVSNYAAGVAAGRSKGERAMAKRDPLWLGAGEDERDYSPETP